MASFRQAKPTPSSAQSARELWRLCSSSFCLEYVKLLYEKANPNHCSAQGVTTLHRAIHQGAEKAIGFLLRKGARATALDSKGRSPLHLAAMTSSPLPLSDLRALFSAAPGASRLRDASDRLPLDLAIHHFNRLRASELVKLDPISLRLPDSKGITPLDRAAAQDRAFAAKLSALAPLKASSARRSP